MKMKQRILALLVAVLFILSSFTGCAGFSLDGILPGGGDSSGGGYTADSPDIPLEGVEDYSGEPYTSVNGGVPYFSEDEITAISFEEYAELDRLGRCGVAFASVGRDLMPSDDREDIGNVHPSGWYYNGVSNNTSYSVIPGYIYNRCHLIGFQLTGENDNERNLVTGTRYLNIKGMLPFENMIADYVKETENHVMYRVTPIYSGNNLVPSGVLMEGYSVEDEGDGICFCVFAYNVQPGIEINYLTGQNRLSGDYSVDISGGNDTGVGEGGTTEDDEGPTYVLNTARKTVHRPDCRFAESMNEDNRAEFFGSFEELLDSYPDYTPCGTCKP